MLSTWPNPLAYFLASSPTRDAPRSAGHVKHPLSLHIYKVRGGGVYRRGVSMSPPPSPRIIQRRLPSPPQSPLPQSPRVSGQRRALSPQPEPEETPDDDQVKDVPPSTKAPPQAPQAPKRPPRPGNKFVRTHSLHGSVHVHVATRKGKFVEKGLSPPPPAPATPDPATPPPPLSCPHLDCGFACGSLEELRAHFEVLSYKWHGVLHL